MTSHEEKRREIGWDVQLPDDAPAEVRELFESIHKPPPRGPLRWIDSYFTHRVVHGLWMERGLVDKDPAKRRSLRRSVWIRAVAAAGCFVMLMLDGLFDDLFVLSPVIRGGIYGTALASLLMWTLNEAQVYRRGWVDGRDAFRDAAREAWSRGMSVEEWWEREYLRDRGTM